MEEQHVKILLWLAIYILRREYKDTGQLKLRQRHEDNLFPTAMLPSGPEAFCEILRHVISIVRLLKISSNFETLVLANISSS